MQSSREEETSCTIDQIGKIPGMSCVKPKGAFYLFPNVSRTELRKDDPARDLLEKCKVVTAPGMAFGSHDDNYIRISLASSMDNIRTTSERMIANLTS
ncbi:MAG: aminotransferase class I/II-fold pyridoxal phosphate-dependent enzyme [Candidatus Bathyarchaeia archaeon]